MDKIGSVIISTDKTTERGGLYLGGYRASINPQFLKNQHITHILNVAAGLVHFFGPKYEVRGKSNVLLLKDLKSRSSLYVVLIQYFPLFCKKSVKTIVEELHIDYLTLSWDDDVEFQIPVGDVIQGMTFIHNARTNGNVFVHCAQVGRGKHFSQFV